MDEYISIRVASAEGHYGLTVPLRGRTLSGCAVVNYHVIEISSSQSNCS